jgi:hypothetical protein
MCSKITSRKKKIGLECSELGEELLKRTDLEEETIDEIFKT